MSLELAVAASGVVASLVGAVLAALLKARIERRREVEREKITTEARVRLTEIGLNFAGLGLTFKVPGRDQPESSVSEQLFKEVEQGIVERIAAQEHLSRTQVVQQVETRMQEVCERVAAVEARFPSTATIDKIASINDALFAQRIEQLTERLSKLEEASLNRWDVALTVSLIVAGIFAVVGATYAVLKALGKVP